MAPLDRYQRLPHPLRVHLLAWLLRATLGALLLLLVHLAGG